VNVADLISVHEARIAHHVAAIGEVDREHRAAAITYRARTVLVQSFVVVRGNVAARKILFNPTEELGIDGHQVSQVPWIGQSLTIQTGRRAR